MKQAAEGWVANEDSMMGAAIAYYTLFSLAPLLLIAIGIAGLVFGQDAARGEIFGSIRGLIGDSGALSIEELLKSSRRSGSDIWATFVGLVTLLIGASTVFGSLRTALNRIWKVPAKETAGWRAMLRERLLSFAMVLTIGFLLLVSLLVTAVLAAAGKYMTHGLPGGEALWQVVNLGVSFGVVSLLFALIFKVLPDTRTPLKDLWLGGVLTAALFTLGKFGIGLYLGKTSVASGFGAAGSLVALLVWIYYSTQILLFGAEFTRAYAESKGHLLEPKDAIPETTRPVLPLGKAPASGVAESIRSRTRPGRS